MGGINNLVQSAQQTMLTPMPRSKPYDVLGQEVSHEYKAMAPYNFAIIDSRSQGISDGRKAEFYPPDERDNPVPGRPTVQIFDPSFKGNDFKRLAAADALHYLGKKDPYLIGIRQKFAKSLTREQKEVDMRAYERARKMGDDRPFDEWFNIHRLDQYLGAPMLPKGSANRREWMGSMTKQQRDMLNNMTHYLKTGKRK